MIEANALDTRSLGFQVGNFIILYVGLHFTKSLLNGVEVWAVRWQELNQNPSCCREVNNSLYVMYCRIVHQPRVVTIKGQHDAKQTSLYKIKEDILPSTN